MLYPVDEVIYCLADRFERFAQSRMPLEQIVTTQEIFDALKYGTDDRNNWAVRVPKPIPGVELDLPVDPWVLGYWLGNGDSRSGALTCNEKNGDREWIVESLRHGNVDAFSSSADLSRIKTRGLTAQLRGVGVLRNKHIPAVYMRASYEQRLALLQGLLDSDGSIDKQGAVEFCQGTKHRGLITQVQELVRSLGIKCGAINETNTNYRYKDSRETAHRLRITFTTDKPVFSLPRKLARLPKQLDDSSHWNYISDVTIGDPVRMRCIKIEHPEHLFLVEGFIPTHNSVTVQSLVYQGLVKGIDSGLPGYRLAIIDTQAKRGDYRWAAPYVHDNWWGCESLAEALTVASLVDEEGTRVGDLINSHGVTKWQELPPEIRAANPPILVVADELAALLNMPNIPAGLTKEAKDLPQFQEMAQHFLESKLLTAKLNRLVAVHRANGVRVIYLTQRPSKTEGFPPELKSLIGHRVMLGPAPSPSDRIMAFRDEKKVPDIPPQITSDPLASVGCGLADLSGVAACVIKGFYAKSEVYEAELRKRLGAGDPSDARIRPTLAQITKAVPQIVAELDDDEIDTDTPGFAVDGRDVADRDEIKGAAKAAHQLALDAAIAGKAALDEDDLL
jgi:replicative DNA helicase